ncbi:alpha,alpha-trehalase TreF [Siphonobacter aquaeclarae]|uniref:Alpha,alpha-trehalase n=1 Tax=Siphonobacter aquaeclarae TaxID=563176 RepID=A0A1G9N2W5_9BACT|nr:alpha,alpha-trehalase TreF [Siphonobacter aquaeclarae]SDL80723.1 alpha,alpha-trehalase [Siphonobacter aquaeclarae]
MRFPLILLAFPILFTACTPAELQTPPSPDEEFGALFHDVQTKALFPDSKTFADAEPLISSGHILKAYEEEKGKPGFDLRAFINQYFEIPKPLNSGFTSDTSLSAEAHINALWPVLTRKPSGRVRGSLLALPRSYVVPGGRFGEIYYWDSYFTMLGLQVAGKDSLIDGMVANFAHLLRYQGHIPNGNRSYYMSRSQPPFFSLMVELLAETKKDPAILVTYLPELQKEYYYWMSASNDEDIKQAADLKPGQALRRIVRMPGGVTLNRYYDDKATPRPEAYKEDIAVAQHSGRKAEDVYRNLRAGAESGWDFSSRWLKDGKTLATIHTTEILPVDLNSLLYHLEMTLSKVYGLMNDTKHSQSFKNLAEKRRKALLQYCWNEKDGFFYDYDFVEGKQTGIPSLAAVYPLFFNLATPEQAKGVARKLKAEFLQAGGLTTTLTPTGQQWDAPNGWAPLQWMSIQGLRQYGENELASEAKSRWIHENIRVYKATGRLVEKYNVYDISLLGGGGEYPLQDGFGWTNGVLLRLLSEK